MYDIGKYFVLKSLHKGILYTIEGKHFLEDMNMEKNSKLKRKLGILLLALVFIVRNTNK